MGKVFAFIDTDTELKSLVKEMQKVKRVALDTEADSLHHYYEKVCLIQLSFEGNHYVVDPLSNLSLSRFLEVLSKKDIILHGADFDLRMLNSCYHFRPKGSIFDTMIASQLLGYEKFGLAAIAEKHCDVKLSKQGQKSDWAKRPLTDGQLIYASDDTRYLEDIAEKLTNELTTMKRSLWHEEACRRLVEVTGEKTVRDPDDLWRIKGSGILDTKVLVYLKELWMWRDSEAQKIDRPPFMILSNDSLTNLAKWLSEHTEMDLSKAPKLPKNIIGARLRALEKAILKARKTPQAEWPLKKRTKRSTENYSKETLEDLRLEVKKIAKNLKLEPSILAPRLALKLITVHRPATVEEIMTVSHLMKWQIELIYPAVQKILKT